MNWEKAKRKDKYFIFIPMVAVAYLISHLTGIRCIWQRIFGIVCPGCGFSRAVWNMLRLDFSAAWHFHPMFWSVFLIVLYFVFEGDVFKSRLVNGIVAGAVAAGFLAVWIYRLCAGIVV